MFQFRNTFLVLMCLLLVGCSSVLYTGLDQEEANRMVSILDLSGIVAETVIDKEGRVSLSVPGDQIGVASAILRANGLPLSPKKTIGDIFKGDGLVSSPQEEQTLFMYAMSQELEKTLLDLDGVLSVSVHVVPQILNNLGDRDPVVKATASVFIKHLASYDFLSLVPQIKTLVAGSLAGLDSENVVVVLFPVAGDTSAFKERLDTLRQNEWYIRLIVGGVIFLVLAGLVWSYVVFGEKYIKNKYFGGKEG